ncbi:MAG TPA: chemotaxis protein CheW [Burkholderiales bacterium]|nr:chemotaxis protein CheW [Burkholderiales bacterium]
MGRQRQDQIHALALPTRAGVLVVPSATIAEVVNVPMLSPLPLSPPWVIGTVGWRSLAVPVVSFEALLGGTPAQPMPASKAVVFYPLSGRSQWEFFALLSAAEPRPQAVDGAAVALARGEMPDSPYIAAGLKFNGQPMWIPNLDELNKSFYP